jgi:hypothetical protein
MRHTSDTGQERAYISQRARHRELSMTRIKTALVGGTGTASVVSARSGGRAMATQWCPQCWVDREVSERWSNGLLMLKTCGHVTTWNA